MTAKTVTLCRGERIVAAVPEHCHGPGWSNSIVWVYIASQDGRLRTECLQPCEQTHEMQTLFDAGAAMCRALVDAVSHMNQWVTAGFHTENGEDMANTMANTIATWTLELNCECPGCGEDVDLLDHADFWHGRNLAVGESSTERSRDVEVVCPACGHEFAVDCRY